MKSIRISEVLLLIIFVALALGWAVDRATLAEKTTAAASEAVAQRRRVRYMEARLQRIEQIHAARYDALRAALEPAERAPSDPREGTGADGGGA